MVRGQGLFDLGGVVVIPLVEIETLEIDPSEFFEEYPKPAGQWWACSPWFDAIRNRMMFKIQSFLVVTADDVILVDGCVGAAKERMRSEFNGLSRKWLGHLRNAGLEPSDVTLVIFTHLHVDHVGWATQYSEGKWRPTFPCARHWVTESELNYWKSSAGSPSLERTGDYIADSIVPLEDAGLLDIVAPNTQFGSYVRLVPAAGHTPGNICVQVSGSDGDILLAGDVLHHPLQLAYPQLNTRYCADPGAARATRTKVLANCARDGTILLPSHFASFSAGRVKCDGSGYMWAPAHEIWRPLDGHTAAKWSSN